MFDTLAPKLNGGNLPSGQPNNPGNNNLGQGSSMSDLNAQPKRGSREHQPKYSTASVAISTGASTRAPSPSVPAVAPAIDADTSFGGDDFFLDAEDLADLEHDLDLGQGQSKVKDKGKDKDNGDDEDISLSWSPTPPKVAKAISSIPLSPQCQFDNFLCVCIGFHPKTNNHFKSICDFQFFYFYNFDKYHQDTKQVYTILQVPSQRNGWDIQHIMYGVQFFSIDNSHQDTRQTIFVLQSLSDGSGSALQRHAFDIFF
ncbi:hypothetical protein BGZ91_006361 [Linnemannia elongata]|nr:hypothetical protein BGZ91_006361 [Linnemannia elongata]